MPIRDWLEEHKPLAIAVALSVVVVAVWLAIPRKQATSAPGIWFWDLTAGELVVLQPPIKSLNGHELVRAHVFACKNCSDPADRFVGYLSRVLTPEPPPGQPPDTNVIPQVSAAPPAEVQWTLEGGERGQALVRQAFGRCPRTLVCEPDQ